jgi:hypothetical protein
MEGDFKPRKSPKDREFCRSAATLAMGRPGTPTLGKFVPIGLGFQLR